MRTTEHEPEFKDSARYRRRILSAILGIAWSAFAVGRDLAMAAPAGHRIRFAPVARTTEHFLAFLAVERGIFGRMGIEADLADTEIGARNAVAGVVDGKWDFAYAGIAQVAESVLQGSDAVLVLTALSANKGGFLMTRPGIREPAQLASASVGVLSESGLTALAARAVLDRWGVSATLKGLGTFALAYDALAAGNIDAAWLPPDLGFKGRRVFGWNALEGVRLVIPGGYVTTRRMIASAPDLVAAAVKALVTAIHFFKTDAAASSDLLLRWLRLEDRRLAEELQRHYAPLFRATPAPSVYYGMEALRESLKPRYATAERLQAPDLIESSLVDALERSGYIARLYSSLRYQ